MKLFLKILSGFLILLAVLLIGANLYFSDERLKSMILPEVREAVGTEVQAEHISLSFWKTFPRMGVEINQFQLPDPDGNTVVRLEELVVGVKLFPLLRDEISISELILNQPELTYHVREDGTTNLDFLFALSDDTEPAEDESGYAIVIPNFTVQSANIFYKDDAGKMHITLSDLDADISLNFAELIESTVRAELGSLSAEVDGENYIDGLSLSLNQTSTIDLENEAVEITEGVFSIRGLALNIHGSVSDWSSEALNLNLSFSSNSDNFGELLRLAPPEFDDHLAELETRGSLDLSGSVSGAFTENNYPNFNLTLNVEDGYLKNPDLPEAMENIRIQLEATNELVTIQQFKADAADNAVFATGTIEKPLEENAVFNLEFDGDVDLATISKFYSIEELGIQDMQGALTAKGRANGRLSEPEAAAFTGTFKLTDGLLQYADVPQPIRGINADVEGSQDKITITKSEFTAASNTFSMSGTVLQPLDENRRNVDVSALLNFDLSTIKDFYPIDEDTLQMRGKFEARVNLKGKVDPEQIEKSLQRSTFNLQNGYLAYHKIGKPLENITFAAEATGNKLSISQAQFKSGQNNMDMKGSVTDYLSENPRFDLTVNGDAVLSDVSAYYSLEPWIQELAGDAKMNIKAAGPAGDPQKIRLNGSLELSEVNAKGDSLGLPVSALKGKLNVTPQAMTLNGFSMKYGASDINLEGRLQNYLGLLDEKPARNALPAISGTYRSNLLNMDEMIDWEDESDDPILIELPQMTSTVTADIKKLVIFGLSVTNITGKGGTTPDQITLDQAKATLFDGTATGKMVWKVPKPDRTHITFSGKLDKLSAEAFFRDTGFLGKNSTIHEYLTGAFSANIDYQSELDETLSPNIKTAISSGSFGMTRARLSGHPIQKKIAEFVKANELSSLALDAWNANFTIKDAVLTLKDFKLTSENIGIELEGTQHLETNKINYKATLALPARFKKGIASVLPNRAADALQREDGTIAVPLRITGTTENPQVRQDNDLIKKILEDYLKDKGTDVIKKLFGN